MAASTNWLMRQYRWLLPRRGSLARGWDRIEAAVALAVLVLALVAVPVGVLAGSGLHSKQAAIAATQRAERHPATAVLLAPTPPDAVGDVSTHTQTVQAQWQASDGTQRVGTIDTGPALAVGDRVGIWLDKADNPVSVPMSGATVLGLAIGFGALVWAGCTVALLLVYWGTRSVLDRARAAAWAREWEAVRWRPRSKGDSK
jgi:hypothetical protein